MKEGFLASVAAAALAPHGAAQRIQLNAPLERVAVGDVLDVRVSADGRFAVYAADLDDSGVARLFSVGLEREDVVVDLGASITRSDLSSDLLPRFELAADGLHVAYLDGPPGPGVALWSVPGDGGASPVRLSPPPVAGGTVTHFLISPDGRRIVYRADQEIVGKFELHAVPVGGGEVVKVSSPLFSGGDVEDDFLIGPDSAAVFYRANPVLRTSIDLLRGSIAGRQPAVRLNPPHGAGQAVKEFRVAPDGLSVVYRGDSAVKERFELFRAPSDGSAPPAVLNAPLVSFGDVHGFELSADGRNVLYIADQEVRFERELYAVPLDGGRAPVVLSSALGPEADVLAALVSPDGRRAVFTTQRPQGVYSAPVDGSAPAVRLDTDSPPVDDQPTGIEISADSGHVVYYRGSLPGTFSVPIDGSRPASRISLQPVVLAPDGRRVVTLEEGDLVSKAIEGTGAVTLLDSDEGVWFPFVVAPVTLQVLYRKSADPFFYPTAIDLFRVSLDGDARPARVNPPFPLAETVGDVASFQMSAKGDRAAFLARGSGYRRVLFGIRLDGGSAPVRLDDAARGPIGSYALTPDGRRVAFSQFSEAAQRPELLCASIDGSGAAISIGVAEDPYLWSITPDGRRLLFFEYDQPTGISEFYGVPLDGSTLPLKLNGTLVEGGSVMFGLVITPDSGRALYLADQDTDELVELYSVPVDGSAPPTKLNVPLSSGSYILGFLLGPDGRHVVYSAWSTWTTGPGTRLFSVPFDGSAPSVPLATAPTFVRDFEIDASGQRVVYLEPLSAGVGELFRVPILGGEVPVSLTPGSLATAFRFELTADDARVVYFADPRSDGGFRVVHDVFSVPLDGSALPVQLNDLPAGPAFHRNGQFSSTTLELSPDGRAVFQEVDRVVSAPADGSASPVLLAAGTGDQAFTANAFFTPDGRTVVLRLAMPNGSALFETATDGSRGLRELSAPSVPYGGIVPYYPPRITADGSRVVYMGDLDEYEVTELFMSLLDRPVRADRTVAR